MSYKNLSPTFPLFSVKRFYQRLVFNFFIPRLMSRPEKKLYPICISLFKTRLTLPSKSFFLSQSFFNNSVYSFNIIYMYTYIYIYIYLGYFFI